MIAPASPMAAGVAAPAFAEAPGQALVASAAATNPTPAALEQPRRAPGASPPQGAQPAPLPAWTRPQAGPGEVEQAPAEAGPAESFRAKAGPGPVLVEDGAVEDAFLPPSATGADGTTSEEAPSGPAILPRATPDRHAGERPAEPFGDPAEAARSVSLEAASPGAATAAHALPLPHLGTSIAGPAAIAAIHAQPSAHPVVSGVPMGAVPVEIGLKSLAGINRFDIRLDPEDLGQIDVRLDISEGGTVKAQIVVETAEALASLHRDSAMLERALEQAGLRTGDEGVSLSLRQQGQGDTGGQRGEGREAPPSSRIPHSDRSENQAAPEQSFRRTASSRASGVDRHI